MMRWTSLLLMCLCMPAIAQDVPSAGREGEVTVKKEATVTVAPDAYEFSLDIQYAGATMEEALKVAAEAKSAIEEAAEGTPFQDNAPTIGEITCERNAQGFICTRSATWSLLAAPFSGPEDRLAQLGAAADAFANVASTLRTGAFEGPTPIVFDPDIVQEDAVELALRESLLPAASAAEVINARVIRTVNVTVESISWEVTSLRSLECTASITVTYDYTHAGIN